MSAESRFFSNRQRAIIAAALSLVALLAIMVGAFILFSWVKEFLFFFKNVIWPIAVAGILALMLQPVIRFLCQRLKLSRTWAIVLTFFIIILGVSILGALILPKAVDQTTRFVKALPQITENGQEFLRDRFPTVYEYSKSYLDNMDWNDLQKSLLSSGNQVKNVGNAMWKRVTGALLTLVTMATLIAVIPIYLFYLLEANRDYGRDVKSHLNFIPENVRDDLVFLGTEFSNIVVAFFRGQLLIGLLMGILMAIGFSLVGLQFGLLLGLLLGLANVVPYLGAILSIVTVLPLAYLQPEGGFTLLGYCVGVLVIVQLIEGYLLTPKIMGKQTGLHPMVIMISIFFWGTALNGILGMILAIPLTATFVIAWRLVQKKYIPLWNDLSGQGNQSSASHG